MSGLLLSDNHFNPKRSIPCFVKNSSYSFGNFNGTSTKNTKKSTVRAKAISYVTDTEPSPAEFFWNLCAPRH